MHPWMNAPTKVCYDGEHGSRARARGPASDGPARMPRQIPFIIANEGCERFSFYGMRNILTPFLTTSLLL